jgi:hypothetical protein
MDAWDDGDCPWCRALLGAGPALTEPGAGRPDDRALVLGGYFHGGGPSARARPAQLLLLPLAVLTVLAALLVAAV